VHLPGDGDLPCPVADDRSGAVPHLEVGAVQGAALDRDLTGAGGSSSGDEGERGVVIGEREPERRRALVADAMPSLPARMAVPCRFGIARATPGTAATVSTSARGTPGLTVDPSTETGDTASVPAPRTDTSRPLDDWATRPPRVLSMLSRSTKVPATKETPSMTANAVRRSRTT
jgi:hypothetical protein